MNNHELEKYINKVELNKDITDDLINKYKNDKVKLRILLQNGYVLFNLSEDFFLQLEKDENLKDFFNNCYKTWKLESIKILQNKVNNFNKLSKKEKIKKGKYFTDIFNMLLMLNITIYPDKTVIKCSNLYDKYIEKKRRK